MSKDWVVGIEHKDEPGEPIVLGPFATEAEAKLAAEMDDALHGSTEPLEWRQPGARTEPKPGHVYVIGGGITTDKWWATYMDNGYLVWQREDFTSRDEAMNACQADWDERDDDE